MAGEGRTGDPIQLDLAEALGATAEVSGETLTIYVPNRDRTGRGIKSARRWVREAADLLARIGGGVTIMPPAEGGWEDEKGKIIWDEPVCVYTYVKPARFVALLPRLREFLHRLGRETNQGEVVVEFADQFFRITRFDQA